MEKINNENVDLSVKTFNNAIKILEEHKKEATEQGLKITLKSRKTVTSTMPKSLLKYFYKDSTE